MKKDLIFHTALSQINWEYVIATFRALDLPWYDNTKPSKNDIVNDLISLMDNAYNNPGTEIITEYWSLTYFNLPKEQHLQIAFTPIVISVNSNETHKIQKRIEELKKRIELHKALEEYEKCSKISKQLAKLEKKINKS